MENRHAGASLRAVSFRISSLSPTQLVHAVPHVARGLLDCRKLLSAPSTKKDSRDAVTLHKFKTQVAALVDGKTSEGRYAGVVLVKTAVDVGGWELLQDCGSKWTRALLAILTKKDPLQTKHLAVVSLTKILLTARRYPSLERELAKPALPTFVSGCLSLDEDLIETSLESFAMLVPVYPTTFRPFQQQIRKLLCAVIGGPYLAGTQRAAMKLWPLMALTVKTTAQAEEWSKSLGLVLQDIHALCDAVFRAVVEQWVSSCGVTIHPTSLQALQQLDDQNDSKLPMWSGIDEGCERLSILLQLVTAYIREETPPACPLPTGRLMDLLSRLFMVTFSPTASKDNTAGLKPNDAISRDEREGLWSNLPMLHSAALALLDTFLQRLGIAAASVAGTAIDMVHWIHEHEKYSSAVRAASYSVAQTLIVIFGAALDEGQVRKLEKVARSASRDVLSASVEKSYALNADSVLNKANGQTKDSTADTTIVSAIAGQELQTKNAAQKLLRAFAYRVDPHLVSSSLRAEVDQACVMSQDIESLVAAVLNPATASENAKPQSSLLPLLARADPSDLMTEALLRPRQPVLVSAAETVDQPVEQQEISSDEDDMDEDDDTLQSSQEGGHEDGGKIAEPARPDNDQPFVLAGLDPELLLSRKRAEPEAAIEEDLQPEKKARLGSVSPAAVTVADAKESRHAVSVSAAEPIVAVETAAAVAADSDSDSDNFVLPELTLEQDTSDEEP